MPASNSTSALALAGQLRALPDRELAALLTDRDIRENSIKDFFDLAEALLDAGSVQKALGRLDRPTLVTLSVISELGETSRGDVATRLTALGADATQLDLHVVTLHRLALVSDEAGMLTAYDTIAARLWAWPTEGLPGFDELVSAPPPTALEPVSSVDARFIDHVAAERAFATTSAISELLAELQREPSRELARGGIALPDSKRLAVAMSVDLDQVPQLNEIAARAGLVVIESGQWMVTPDAAEWHVKPSGTRWSRLAGAWLDRLPPDFRTILAERVHAIWGERLEEYVEWLFPAGGDWIRERIDVYTRDAELLGISTDSTPSGPGAVLLAEGAESAAAAMSSLFPSEVDKVYLQHDLTIVSPGPLEPRLDAQLRAMADVESRALASTYRISSASVNRALAAGETAKSLLSFLSSISLSGIPQPLEYLVAETSARFGLLRVGTLSGEGATPGTVEYGARSYIRSQDAALLGTLVVDQSLSPIGLTRTGEYRLVSRFDRDVVFWSLSEARYPVAAEDERGEVIALKRRSAPVRSAAPVLDRATALVEKLRLGTASDTEETTSAAWLARQLDQAIRNKVPLTVTVQMPNGTAVDYQLEPASVAGGRLRARDRNSEIERTLPLSSITAIAPAE